MSPRGRAAGLGSAIGILGVLCLVAGAGIASAAYGDSGDPSVTVTVSVPTGTSSPSPTAGGSITGTTTSSVAGAGSGTGVGTTVRASSGGSAGSSTLSGSTNVAPSTAPTPPATPAADAAPATLSNPHPHPGDAETITADGFTPGEQVQLVLYSTPVVIGSTAADGAGAVRMDFTVPTDVGIGRHTAELTGWQSGHVANATFAIDGAAPPASAGLTGDQWRLMILIALAALLAAALIALVVVRRRNRKAALS